MSRKLLNVLVAIILVLVLLVYFSAFAIWMPKSPDGSATTEGTTTEPIEPTTASTTTEPSLPPIQQDMQDNGGGIEGSEYVLDEDVNPDLDQSTTGEGAVNIDGIRTPQAMVDWLSEKTTRGLAAITSIKEATNASEDLILDIENWHVLQALVDGFLTDNTGFKDGKIVNVGSRDVKRGDIFLVFVNPTNHKVIYFRGACANPQGFTPQLNPKPTPTPTSTTTKSTTSTTTRSTTAPTTSPTTTLQPKSSDPDDYIKPGDDDTTDSGEGVKPTVPTVSETAETTPPPVVTTTAPSETIIAPEATPIPTAAPTAAPTPTPVPALPTPEPTVTETIVNPFG